MAQTKRQSAVEAMTNIFVGYTINIMANFAIFPVFGWTITLQQNLLMGCFFTVVSFARSYCLRRFYNYRHRNDQVIDTALNCPKCLTQKKDTQSYYAEQRALADSCRTESRAN